MSYKLGIDHPPHTQVNNLADQLAIIKTKFAGPVIFPFAAMFPQTVDSDITVPPNYNALIVGEYGVAAGVTITVEDGASLSII